METIQKTRNVETRKSILSLGGTGAEQALAVAQAAGVSQSEATEELRSCARDLADVKRSTDALHAGQAEILSLLVSFQRPNRRERCAFRSQRKNSISRCVEGHHGEFQRVAKGHVALFTTLKDRPKLKRLVSTSLKHRPEF